MDAFGTWKAKKGVKEMERRQSKHFRRQFREIIQFKITDNHER